MNRQNKALFTSLYSIAR